MANVTIRELRNRCGAIVDRAVRGEPITIMRFGRPVAELRPLAPPPLSAEALLSRWRHLPARDHAALATLTAPEARQCRKRDAAASR